MLLFGNIGMLPKGNILILLFYDFLNESKLCISPLITILLSKTYFGIASDTVLLLYGNTGKWTSLRAFGGIMLNSALFT